jgi:hypothetical protein
MYFVHNIDQIHHFFNVPKKLNLLIIVAGGSTISSSSSGQSVAVAPTLLIEGVFGVCLIHIKVRHRYETDIYDINLIIYFLTLLLVYVCQCHTRVCVCASYVYFVLILHYEELVSKARTGLLFCGRYSSTL